MKHHHFIDYKHHHLNHIPNSYMLVFTGIFIQIISSFFLYVYISKIIFLLGTIIIMSSLYLLKHSRDPYLDPVKYVVGLMCIGSISFVIYDTLYASIIYLTYSIYLFLIFDVKKEHLGIRKKKENN